ncbi:MAG: penicillin-binding protein 2 [Anaerosomatales bacterium]|nr:penicillin-binding protein 2 [Anaerosomatales bacterium]MDT8433554.1 penicillin-binding protein 2 [Anaerosomatales bacterium]
MATFRERLKPRYATLGIIFLSVLGVLFLRAWSIQVINADRYAAAAENNRVREIAIDAPRGRILDRNGNPLVTNRATLGVTVAPGAKDDEDMLYRLSVVLEMPLDDLMERVSSTREAALKPRLVALDVPMTVVAYLAEHETEYPGVEVSVVPVREYPHGSLAAHVLGYTGEISEESLNSGEMEGYVLGDLVGKSGAEWQFESVLQGEKGYRRVEVDAVGSPRHVLEEAEPVAGRDVVLTIDLEIQQVAEEALERALVEARADDFLNARAGAAVALDVHTGEVLAMASVPTFDPTLFIGGISTRDWEALTAEDSEYPLNNRAIQAAYPPASTYKAITGMAGLEFGVTSLGHSYYCAGRWTGMGEQWSKFCWKRSGHGSIGFTRGVAESCDVVFYEIGYEFYKRDREELQEFARRFGVGSVTGIDLPGEVSGRVPDAAWKAEFNANYPEYRQWLPGDTVNMVIGQGDLLTTPLQMAAVYAGIANDGDVMRPHVLKEVLDSRGEAVRAFEPEVAFSPEVSPETLRTMHNALLAVTESGTGRSALRGFAERVAGKTGTAEVAGKDDYAWFTAYAPADDPQYAVAVVIEQGGGGGAVAGPAARKILAALLGLPVEHVQATDVSR